MEVIAGSDDIVFNRRKSPKTVETRKPTNAAGDLSQQKATSLLKKVVRMNLNSLQDANAVDNLKRRNNFNSGKEANRFEKGVLSKKVMKRLAGWSAVKMFERYVPEVVMQQIVFEVTASMKSTAKQSSIRSSLIPLKPRADASKDYSSKRIRRKSLRLKKSMLLQKLQDELEEELHRDGGRVTIEENCTVVLADISGFTKLADKLSKRPDGSGTEVLSSKLNKYFGRMIDMIYAGGGDVIKFAGDALLVVWRENKKKTDESESILYKNKTQGKATIDRNKNTANFRDRIGIKNRNTSQANQLQRKQMRRKRSSIHVVMSNRSLTQATIKNDNNTTNSKEQPTKRPMNANMDVAENTLDWRSQMKQFRDTLGDKKMKEKTRRDRALTSMSDRISHTSQNSFENLAVYRGSNASDMSKKEINENVSKPLENSIEIGPEVTDFIAMIREELENGKLSPEQYLNVVRQRYDLYFQGHLSGMGML